MTIFYTPRYYDNQQGKRKSYPMPDNAIAVILKADRKRVSGNPLPFSLQ